MSFKKKVIVCLVFLVSISIVLGGFSSTGGPEIRDSATTQNVPPRAEDPVYLTSLLTMNTGLYCGNDDLPGHLSDGTGWNTIIKKSETYADATETALDGTGFISFDGYSGEYVYKVFGVRRWDYGCLSTVCSRAGGTYSGGYNAGEYRCHFGTDVKKTFDLDWDVEPGDYSNVNFDYAGCIYAYRTEEASRVPHFTLRDTPDRVDNPNSTLDLNSDEVIAFLGGGDSDVKNARLIRYEGYDKKRINPLQPFGCYAVGSTLHERYVSSSSYQSQTPKRYTSVDWEEDRWKEVRWDQHKDQCELIGGDWLESGTSYQKADVDNGGRLHWQCCGDDYIWINDALLKFDEVNTFSYCLYDFSETSGKREAYSCNKPAARLPYDPVLVRGTYRDSSFSNDLVYFIPKGGSYNVDNGDIGLWRGADGSNPMYCWKNDSSMETQFKWLTLDEAADISSDLCELAGYNWTGTAAEGHCCGNDFYESYIDSDAACLHGKVYYETGSTELEFIGDNLVVNGDFQDDRTVRIGDTGWLAYYDFYGWEEGGLGEYEPEKCFAGVDSDACKEGGKCLHSFGEGKGSWTGCTATQTISVTPGEKYKYLFWNRGSVAYSISDNQGQVYDSQTVPEWGTGDDYQNIIALDSWKLVEREIVGPVSGEILFNFSVLGQAEVPIGLVDFVALFSVEDSTADIRYNDTDYFYECLENDNVKIKDYYSGEADIVKDASICTSLKGDDHYCDFDGVWKPKTVDGKTVGGNTLQYGISDTTQKHGGPIEGCCPSNMCWNGSECIAAGQEQDLGITNTAGEKQSGKTHVCEMMTDLDVEFIPDINNSAVWKRKEGALFKVQIGEEFCEDTTVRKTTSGILIDQNSLAITDYISEIQSLSGVKGSVSCCKPDSCWNGTACITDGSESFDGRYQCQVETVDAPLNPDDDPIIATYNNGWLRATNESFTTSVGTDEACYLELNADNTVSVRNKELEPPEEIDFDPFIQTPYAGARTHACCGPSECWNGTSCVSFKDKSFDDQMQCQRDIANFPDAETNNNGWARVYNVSYTTSGLSSNQFCFRENLNDKMNETDTKITIDNKPFAGLGYGIVTYSCCGPSECWNGTECVESGNISFNGMMQCQQHETNFPKARVNNSGWARPYNVSFTTPKLNNLYKETCYQPSKGANYTETTIPDAEVDTYGCCKPTECWNGTTCVEGVNSPNENHFKSVAKNSTGAEFACILAGNKASWTRAIPKLTPWGSSGYCDEEAKCLISLAGSPDNDGNITAFYTQKGSGRPACFVDGQYFEDWYCDNGEWSSRTKLLAEAMFDNSSKEYLLHCGEGEEILNYYSTQTAQDNYLPNKRKFNNFCVFIDFEDEFLQGDDIDTYLGTTLNQNRIGWLDMDIGIQIGEDQESSDEEIISKFLDDPDESSGDDEPTPVLTDAQQAYQLLMNKTFGVNLFKENCYETTTNLNPCSNEDNIYWDKDLFMIVKKEEALFERITELEKANLFELLIKGIAEKLSNWVKQPEHLETFKEQLKLSYLNETVEYSHIFLLKKDGKEIRAIREAIKFDDRIYTNAVVGEYFYKPEYIEAVYINVSEDICGSVNTYLSENYRQTTGVIVCNRTDVSGVPVTTIVTQRKLSAPDTGGLEPDDFDELWTILTTKVRIK